MKALTIKTLIKVIIFFSVSNSDPIDVTISKIGVNVCLGNSADFCDSTWLSYPNLNAALFGIDRPSLNPVPNDFISEPGVRAQIFQGTYRDETGSMAQYDFVQTIDDLRCAAEFKESIFYTFEEIIEGWSSFAQRGNNIQIGSNTDLTVPLPGGASISTTIPPLFSRSESHSNEAAEMEEHFNAEHGSVAHSRAECSIYRVLIDISNPSLTLYSGFESALLKMDTIVRNNGVANEKIEAGIWFVDQYGTHYARSSQMGSSIAFETRYDETETNSHNQSTLMRCSTISGSRVFGFQLEDDSHECTGSLENTTFGEDTSVKRTIHTTIGSFPAGAGSLAEWSQQLQDMARDGNIN